MEVNNFSTILPKTFRAKDQTTAFICYLNKFDLFLIPLLKTPVCYHHSFLFYYLKL